jgi:myo-inositol-1-phosphate synthase
MKTENRLAILTPGIGAVSTTLFAGVEAIKRGLAKPIGSLTQLGSISTPGGNSRSVASVLGLPALRDVEFGGWDIFNDDAHRAAVNARVIEPELLNAVKRPLSAIRPMSAVFDPKFVRLLAGPNVKKARNKMALAEAVRDDIRRSMKKTGCSRAVMVNCASTEAHFPVSPVHRSLPSFEAGLKNNHPAIAPSMIYAYAALREGVPVANGTPGLWSALPFLRELAEETATPIAGCDFKTGQTLLKSILAPGLRRRHLGVSGWVSFNILGNRDGKVLSDPGAFRAKEISKSSLLQSIFDGSAHPELYGDFHHLVDIKYYPPRGDDKEAWDNVDIFGWLGYRMQLKINFLCRDSILAAPVALDLALLLDAAKRAGRSGFQDWLAFYFKSPAQQSGPVEHDLAVQAIALESAIRQMGVKLSGLRQR